MIPTSRGIAILRVVLFYLSIIIDIYSPALCAG